jgi:CBS domain-containing protein
VQEFIDFLGTQPPFDALSADDLRRLARHVKVKYVPAGTTVVEPDDEVLDHMWIVRSGQFGVYDRGREVDILGVGDVFGHVSVLSGLRPALSVAAIEDSLCYQLPDPRSVLEHPELLQFSHFGTSVSRQRLVEPGVLAPKQAPISRFVRPIVWVRPDDTVAHAAALMTERDASCVLAPTEAGLGIATDRDFRSHVATGRIGVTAPVEAIVCVPATCIPITATVSEALILMVEECIHHLVVTDHVDEPVGVVRAIDLGSVDVRDPLLIRTAISSAREISDLQQACSLVIPTLAELADNDVPAVRIGALQTAMTEAVLRKLLELTPPSEASPDEVSWLVLGSLARREPLPASDIDTALVWEGSRGAASDGAAARRHATTVLDRLIECGFEKCANGANADNALFSQSAVQWAASARQWISHPDADGALLLSSIVADSRPVTNLAVGKTITDSIRATTQSQEFRETMLRYAVATKPPFGFVRDFVTDHRGEHRGGFDLKTGGLQPIVSLARWSALVFGDVSGSTLDRSQRARESGLFTDGEADVLTRAFDDIYSLLFHREISALRDRATPTTWVQPRELDTLRRRHLRESFRAVSDVQETVSGGWRLRLGIS